MSSIIHDINSAITALQEGKVVAIPTETVYGLAGNAENTEAVKKIFALKNRPINHPLIMHVAKDWDLSKWVLSVPDYAQKLIDAFWPGPLTLVFNARTSGVNPAITGGQPTIAIRCPNHPTTQALLIGLGCPLAAPSANPFGKISPTTSAHVQQSFPNQELLILEGGRCELGIESTIVSAIAEDGYTILRHGSISAPLIHNTLQDVRRLEDQIVRAPGSLDTHYQPEKPLYCFEDPLALKAFCENDPKVYALFFSPELAQIIDVNQCHQLPDNPTALAYELYYQLRQADQSSAKKIAIELPPNEEVWQAIRERLLKASVKPL